MCITIIMSSSSFLDMLKYLGSDERPCLFIARSELNITICTTSTLIYFVVGIRHRQIQNRNPELKSRTFDYLSYDIVDNFIVVQLYCISL